MMIPTTLRSLPHAVARAVFILALWYVAAGAQAWPARVVHVTDGDTVTVVNRQSGDRERVRLAGMDAPEVAHGRGWPEQPYGLQAAAALRGLLKQGVVAVHPNGTHSYDRIVGTITVDGRDVAHALIRAGLAWDDPRYDQSGRYIGDQQHARAARLGLWHQTHPSPPWRWRHRRH